MTQTQVLKAVEARSPTLDVTSPSISGPKRLSRLHSMWLENVSTGWHWLPEPSANTSGRRRSTPSSSWLLEWSTASKVKMVTYLFCGAGAGTQGLIHAR